MTAPSGTSREASSDNITRGAQWLADRRQFTVGAMDLVLTEQGLAPTLPEISRRFGLTDADAAEAILLAGNFSICRKAYG